MSELPAEEPGFTEDRLLGGRIRLKQPAAGYRVAIDPVFLAAANSSAVFARITSR